MKRQLATGLGLALVAAFILACGTEPASQLTAPSAPVATASSPAATVDDYVGTGGADTTGGTPEPDLADNTAVSIVANGVCTLVEFKVEKQADGKAAKIVFAATCANARLRGVGLGQLSNGVLYWKAEGVLALASGRTCQFRFVEGNRAATAGEGFIKVAYNGTVCDVPVSGSQVVKRK
jgi:hypothetical protein